MENERTECEPLVSLINHLTPQSVITLRSKDKEGALKELAGRAAQIEPAISRAALLQAVWEREELVSTGIGDGIAIPHAHMPLGSAEFVIVIGRSRGGIPYFSGSGERDVAKLIVLVVSDEGAAHAHLRVLSALANVLRDEQVREKIIAAHSARAAIGVVRRICDRRTLPPVLSQVTQATLEQAEAIADAVGADTLLIYASALTQPTPLYLMDWRKRVIFATHSTWQPREGFDAAASMITLVRIPPVNLARMGQVRLGILFAVSRGLLKRGDVVVCLAGQTGSDVLDTIVTIDIADSIARFLPEDQRSAPSDVEPEVLERVIGLACSLAIERREGRPVGTIFVVGDAAAVAGNVKQLVINPFRGYAAEHLNVLDPSMEETIKEFSAIDGAFVIRGDGVIQSAGTYLTPPAVDLDLPSGLGTRHRSACAMTAATKAYAVVISQTAGTVTVFKSGRIFVVIERPESAVALSG